MEKRLVIDSEEDEDNPIWTAKDFAEARPARDMLPKKLFNALVANQKKVMAEKKRGRGPGKKPVKVLTSIRLDALVVDHFKAKGRSTGRKWQAMINEVLLAVLAAPDTSSKRKRNTKAKQS